MSSKTDAELIELALQEGGDKPLTQQEIFCREFNVRAAEKGEAVAAAVIYRCYLKWRENNPSIEGPILERAQFFRNSVFSVFHRVHQYYGMTLRIKRDSFENYLTEEEKKTVWIDLGGEKRDREWSKKQGLRRKGKRKNIQPSKKDSTPE